MSYFEVLERDGPGRIGELKCDQIELETPCLIDQEAKVRDLGSLWGFDEREISSDSRVDFNILPTKSTPPHVKEEVFDIFLKESIGYIDELKEVKGFNIPAINVNKSTSANKRELNKLRDFKAVLIENVDNLLLPQELIESLVGLKEKLSEDTAIYIPGAATPTNLAILVYLGIDLFDTYKAKYYATNDRYFTDSGSINLGELDYLPCNCEVCRDKDVNQLLSLSKRKRIDKVYRHNSNAIKREINRIKESLKKKRLRELVEERIRPDPEITSLLKYLDYNKQSFLEARTAVTRKSNLYANTEDSLNRVEIKRFRDRIVNRLSGSESDYLVVTPCSARKPYSFSKTHQIIEKGRKGRGDKLILTSPLGVVPSQLDIVYPAQHYDIPVIGKWTENEKKLIEKTLRRYLIQKDYEKILIHVKELLREITERVSKELGLDYVSTSKGRDPRDQESIKKLRRELKDVQKRINRPKKIFRSLMEYQLGLKDLNYKKIQVKGRYPKYRFFDDENQIATLTHRYGFLAFTLEGGRRYIPKMYKVKIENFVPQGSVLAPGVIEAGDEIRPNDEVLFEGESAIGVGRAEMSSLEMERSNRGIAIKVRHVEEK
ncbi:MAG: Queuine tRNA-ribosyltransferase containing PUA domain [Candidatus Methanohalarchaeum thermophilum]|uniref:Queuine tRNA-ribosyltransferase containing PUA domain n=1 Tax=Methanohalarchaeum thermophilum TaxID=1903181 RepID=A0A1Q6DUZ7_METT1|nr:MAG: Queuine tRNA-ribosyltransferase containing PUA domain [Candidatus Methanohalarchaeum thermophilum]